MVTPYLGVWIEISFRLINAGACHVTPYLGVWIEIYFIIKRSAANASLPTWKCGLKFCNVREFIPLF